MTAVPTNSALIGLWYTSYGTEGDSRGGGEIGVLTKGRGGTSPLEVANIETYGTKQSGGLHARTQTQRAAVSRVLMLGLSNQSDQPKIM